MHQNCLAIMAGKPCKKSDQRIADDELLRRRLQQLGLSPGPITDTTREVFQRKLERHVGKLASYLSSMVFDLAALSFTRGLSSPLQLNLPKTVNQKLQTLLTEVKVQ